MNGNLFPRGAIVYNGPSANKPPASTLQHGDVIFLNDAPDFFGGYWMAIPLANAYQPLNGELTTHSLSGNPDTGDSGTEQLLTQFSMPPGSYFYTGSVELKAGFAKSAAVESCVIRIRVGETGTVADPIALSFAMSAAALSLVIAPNFRFTSDTTMSPDNNGFLGEAITPWANDVIIPSLADSTLYFSVTAQMSGILNVVTLKKCEAKYTIG